MKQTTGIFALFFVFLFASAISNAQESDFKQRRWRPDQSKFENFILEAYGNRADELVFDRPSRLKTLKNLFENSFIFVENGPGIEVPDYFPELSSISLVTRYNSSVTAGTFNPLTFNPFKYDFNFYSKERQFFHVDGTNYFIIIEPFEIRN